MVESPISTPTTLCCFFFNDTATTEIYTLSLHDALPIYSVLSSPLCQIDLRTARTGGPADFLPHVRFQVLLSVPTRVIGRSEEHTSELQSRRDLVCRLLLEKKKKINTRQNTPLHTIVIIP